MNNPYEVLGVNPYADEQTIKKAYRQLSKTYHPDNNINNPNRKQAEERFKDIQEAYEQIMSGKTGNFGTTYGPGSSRYNGGQSNGSYGAPNSGFGYGTDGHRSGPAEDSSRHTNYSDNYYTGTGYNGRAYSQNAHGNNYYNGNNGNYYNNGNNGGSYYNNGNNGGGNYYNGNNNDGYYYNSGNNGNGYYAGNGQNGGFSNNQYGYNGQNQGAQGNGWQNTGSRNYWDGVRATATNEEEASALNYIADMINKGMFNDAIFELTGIKNRSALWYYYSAVANLALGNNLTARSHAQMAYDMEPARREYFDLFTGIDQGTLKYKGQNQVYANNGNKEFADKCGKIIPCVCGLMLFGSGGICRFGWIFCI